jgi:predicted dehydrogenase
VLIATPMEFHAAQTIEALERDIHVLCEVTAGVTVAECRAVVEAASRSTAHYAMAENFLYAQYTQIVAKLIEDGRFGEPHYAEGEYLMHGAFPSTVWRRKWMVGRKGVTCEDPAFSTRFCSISLLNLHVAAC